MPHQAPYTPPPSWDSISLKDVLPSDRPPVNQQGCLSFNDQRLYYVGDLSLLNSSCISIIGSRKVSASGAARARRLARELSENDVVIISGLALGVDTEALTSALHSGGRVIGVIGTPLAQVTPRSNGWLQEEIYKNHLLISPFKPGSGVYRSNFPRRNKVMAALSHGSVVVEATDTSGTLHQSAECQRLGRWLFILKSIIEDPRLKWPHHFLESYGKTVKVNHTADITDALQAE